MPRITSSGPNACLAPTELTEEHDLQREIPELFLDVNGIVFVDRVDHLARLFQDVAAQGFHVLLAIPRTAPFPEQALHQRDQAGVSLTVLLGERQRFGDRKRSVSWWACWTRCLIRGQH